MKYTKENVIGTIFESAGYIYKVTSEGHLERVNKPYVKYTGWNFTEICHHLNRGSWKVINSPTQIHELWN